MPTYVGLDVHDNAGNVETAWADASQVLAEKPRMG
jgi:hypothetical protein